MTRTPTALQMAWINTQMERGIRFRVGNRSYQRKPVDYKLDICGMGVFFVIPDVGKGQSTRGLKEWRGPLREEYVLYPNAIQPEHKQTPRRPGSYTLGRRRANDNA